MNTDPGRHDAPRVPQPVDLLSLGRSLPGPWASVPIATLRIGRAQLRVMEARTAPWHVHEDSAEAFLVLEGGFWIDVEQTGIRVEQGQWLVVPPGVRHRARATTRVLLMVMDDFGQGAGA